MEKTILRILEDAKLSKAVSDQLEELLPGHTLELFKAKPDDRGSVKRRMVSLHEAFLFILEAYPPDSVGARQNKEILKFYADDALAASNLSSERLTDLHRELERFASGLINVLFYEWKSSGITSLAQACALLNEAEQYVIMSKGRHNTATLTPMDFGQGPEYLLQVDRILPAYYDQWLDELRVIQASAYTNCLDWFAQLKPFEQVYLSSVDKELLTPVFIIEDLTSLQQNWLQIKKLALNADMDLAKIHKSEQPLPEWFNKLAPAKKEMIKILADAPANKVGKLIGDFITTLNVKSLRTSFKDDLMHLRQLPLWYLVLPKHQKMFLKHVINDVQQIQDVVYFLPSRLRMLPAPANFAQHRIFRVNERDGIVPLSPWRFRFSHVISRDMNKEEFEAVQARHSNANLDRVFSYAESTQKILFQTLISPLSAPIISEYTPDLALYSQARTSISNRGDRKRIFQHNHPLNMAKFFFGTGASDERSLAIISDTEEVLQSLERVQKEIKEKEHALNVLMCMKDIEHKEDSLLAQIADHQQQLVTLKNSVPVFYNNKETLADLLEDYKSVLNSPLGTSSVYDYTGRELFLSSLEQLIFINQDGFSSGSCVSGKDRKAIELIHTNAMLIHKTIYGFWPKFNDQSVHRSRFVALVADIYCTNHQQMLAGQNAPGADGIKTVDAYFPKDISTEINRRFEGGDRIELDDMLATDNEVKNIFSQSKLEKISRSKLEKMPTGELESIMIACQLGADLCDDLYNALAPLIDQQTLFISHKKDVFRLWDHDSSVKNNLPTGISSIHSLMHSLSAGNSNVQRIAKIIDIVLDRAEKDSSRNGATNAVYKGIRGLKQYATSSEKLQEHALILITQWNKIFNKSKEVRSGNSSSDEESPSHSPISASV